MRPGSNSLGGARCATWRLRFKTDFTRQPWPHFLFLLLAVTAVAVGIDHASGNLPPVPSATLPPVATLTLPQPFNSLEERTFRYFWDNADPVTGLIPDRFPTPSAASVAAVGFALTAYPIGAERGYVTRAEARGRVLKTRNRNERDESNSILPCA